MDDYTIIILSVLIFIILYCFVRVTCALACQKKGNEGFRTGQGPVRRRVVQRIRIDPGTSTAQSATDRQGNIFTIPDELTNNPRQHSCPDFFYVEPNSEDAARIRAQLEKDDKDLPSYEEVMGLSGNRHVPAVPLNDSSSAVNMGMSTSSVETTDTTLTVPPYSEIDPAPITTRATVTAAAMTATSVSPAPTQTVAILTIANEAGRGNSTTHANNEAAASSVVAPSTSRAAATTLTLSNSASNTSV